MVNTVISNNKEEVETNNSKETIKVHIYGAVKNPGLIELIEGSRINDAIEIAGGLTEEADISKINLAYILSDGEKIYIASINDKDIQNIEENVQNSQTQKININTAGILDLTSLDGIGESLAKSIVEYRNKNGKFLKLEDIKNVSGIGDSKFEKIKDSICVR